MDVIQGSLLKLVKKSGNLAYVVKSYTEEYEKAVSDHDMEAQERTKKRLETLQKELAAAVLAQDNKRMKVFCNEEDVAHREKAYIKAKNNYCSAAHQETDGDSSD